MSQTIIDGSVRMSLTRDWDAFDRMMGLCLARGLRREILGVEEAVDRQLLILSLG